MGHKFRQNHHHGKSAWLKTLAKSAKKRILLTVIINRGVVPIIHH